MLVEVLNGVRKLVAMYLPSMLEFPRHQLPLRAMARA